MSGEPGPCTECQGKYGPGPLCGTCESLVRLRLFVSSGRCPSSVGGFISQRVRECHRAILEEAERFWASQPIREVLPGLQSTGKAPPATPPPLASGGGVTSEVEKGPKKGAEGARSPGEERQRRKKTPDTRESKHRHRSKSREKRKRRKHRSRSRSVPAEVLRSEKASSPRLKKVKEEEETPPEAAREESGESEEGTRASEASVENPAGAGGEAAGSGRSPLARRVRTPSKSPPGYRKWEGPLPAAHHRPRHHQPPKKKPKKNKGAKKREHQRQWLQDFGRYRGRDYGHGRR